jgi:hypothetical protein
MASDQTAALELCEPWGFPRPLYRRSLDDSLQWRGIDASSVELRSLPRTVEMKCDNDQMVGK